MIRRMLAIAVTTLALAGTAQAQPWGYAPHPPQHWSQDADWERERWERRTERREMRREFWRQQREIEARRAYEAGLRDAQRGPWGYSAR